MRAPRDFFFVRSCKKGADPGVRAFVLDRRSFRGRQDLSDDQGSLVQNRDGDGSEQNERGGDGGELGHFDFPLEFFSLC